MRKLLARARNPALWLSFGKDSLLVLKLALDAGFTGPCYYFGDELSDFAQQVIINHALTVYSWPATNRYLVPSGDKWAQVDEFLVGNALVPALSPVVQGDDCTHLQFHNRFTKQIHYPHDVTLTGYKRSDINEAVGVNFPREINLGFTRLVHPLYDWSDDEVLTRLGYTPPEENSVAYCDRCLAAIESLDRDAALASFRRRFHFPELKETRNVH
jgi:hypothetical protein